MDGAFVFGLRGRSVAPSAHLPPQEYLQRVTTRTRGVLAAAAPEGAVDGDLPAALLAFATSNGYAACGLDGGRLEAGALADLAAVDLGAAPLRGSTGGDDLTGRLVFSGSASVVRETCVGGDWQ